MRPLARIVVSTSVGVHPAYVGIGPIPATLRVLERSGLRVADIDLVEINEAFASQVLACIRDLALDEERVNVNGGAIALGHPLGCSGARLVGTLALELRRRARLLRVGDAVRRRRAGDGDAHRARGGMRD